jgi:tRNA threonylcarbamoyladenosine biosynthesis protein TsaE
MATFISRSPEDTLELGERWGREIQTGWVVGLTGDLGAGKTQLVKGIARGLGVTGRVHSPTFALINTYDGGRLPLFHLDLYRLETREEMTGAGLDEYFFRPQGVTVVEWVERWLGKAGSQNSWVQGSPARLRQVWIDTISETERSIRYEDSGA